MVGKHTSIPWCWAASSPTRVGMFPATKCILGFLVTHYDRYKLYLHTISFNCNNRWIFCAKITSSDMTARKSSCNCDCFWSKVSLFYRFWQVVIGIQGDAIMKHLFLLFHEVWLLLQIIQNQDCNSEGHQFKSCPYIESMETWFHIPCWSSCKCDTFAMCKPYMKYSIILILCLKGCHSCLCWSIHCR